MIVSIMNFIESKKKRRRSISKQTQIFRSHETIVPLRTIASFEHLISEIQKFKLVDRIASAFVDTKSRPQDTQLRQNQATKQLESKAQCKQIAIRRSY